MAKMRGYKEIAEGSKQAMEGNIPFKESFEKRLNIIKPDAKLFAQLSELYAQHLTPQTKEVIKKLQSLGKKVMIITHQIKDPVIPVAKQLNIPEENIIGNEVTFDEQGTYKKLNNTILNEPNGKLKILQTLPQTTSAFVGDGATDLATQELVDIFIGFGGVLVRPKVEAEAKFFIKERSLLPILDIILTDEEKERLQKQ